MRYAKIVDGGVSEYPYSIQKLRKENPNTSFPKVMTVETLESWGVYSVSETEQPTYNKATQKISEGTPTLVDGSWTQNWVTEDKDSEEIAADTEVQAQEMRSLRDAYLAETDWWAVSDRTMTAEQTSYRQALRDITGHTNWPYLNDDEDWPVKP